MIPVLLAFLALSPEKKLTDPPRVQTARIVPQTPRVASDGGGFFIVWNGGSSAAHVSSDGTVLDRPSLHIDAPPNVRFFDLIRYRGGYVIGWYYSTDAGIVHIRADRFDVELPDADLNSDSFRLVANGSEIAAIYRLKSGGAAFTILDSNRTVALDRVGAAASDGKNFLVLQGTSAVLLSSVGDRTATVPLAFSASDVVFDGSDYAVVGAIRHQIETMRVSRSGSAGVATIAGSAGGDITGLTLTATSSDVTLAWKETNAYPPPSPYFSVSLRMRSGTTTTVSATMDETVGRFDGWTDPPSLASNSRDVLLVWTEGTSLENLPSRKLFSVLLDPNDTLDTNDLHNRQHVVSTAYATQSNPASARSGDHLLVAWSETVNNELGDPQNTIAAALLTSDGDILDGSGVIIAPTVGERPPSAAWDGSRTWIAWPGDHGVSVVAFLPDGTASQPLFIPGYGGGPRIACGEDACLVVWASGNELFGNRIAHGQLLDEIGVLIATVQSPFVTDYDVASDGSHFETVWIDRLPAGGAILRSSAGDLAATTGNYSNVHVVWNGSEYDVFWNQGSALRGSRLGANGHSLDGDATGWAGVRIDDDLTLNDVKAVNGVLYVGTATSIVQLDPATLSIVNSGEIAHPTSIAALDRDHVFVLYSNDGPLLLRRVGSGRTRAAR